MIRLGVAYFLKKISIVCVESNSPYRHIKCTLNFYETAKNKDSFAVSHNTTKEF